MTSPATHQPKLVPVNVQNLNPGGGTRVSTVHGETTASEHLVITPGFRDGQFDDCYWLIHVPTGLLLTSGEPHMLREVAGRVAHLDWATTTAKNFPGSQMALEAKVVIRELAFTDPTAVEMPAHDMWGPDGKGQGLKRAAVPMVTDLLADVQRCLARLHGDDAVPMDVPDPGSPSGKRPNPEWTLAVHQKVTDFGLIYLILVLHRVDPGVADSVAAWLADEWDAGDSIGEWTWEWHQALLKGEQPRLPGVPVLGDLFTTKPERGSEQE